MNVKCLSVFRAGQPGRREAVFSLSGSSAASGSGLRGVCARGQRPANAVQEVCTDGQEDGRHQGALQGSVALFVLVFTLLVLFLSLTLNIFISAFIRTVIFREVDFVKRQFVYQLDFSLF